MDTSATFGWWLRRRRKTLDLTQRALAELVGCSVGMIRSLEADTRRPSHTFAERLAVKLEVAPHERAAFIKAARAAVAVEELASPHAVVGAALPFGLPTPLTSLIGREGEVAQLCAQLRRDDVRLLTLTGAPGSGKTRLGLAVAAALLPHFSDGVWFVGLAAIRAADTVLPTITQTLSLGEYGGSTPLAALAFYLHDKHCLLLLDNVEQVVDVGPQLAALLSQVPGLKIVATSRVPLHINGEHRFAVPPLPLPDVANDLSPEQLQGFAAIRLFNERARAVHNAFAFTPVNAAAVVEICRCLDGLPLAIELAAARTSLFAPQQLLDHLDSRLALLVGGPHDMPQRQQSLRATLDWSYNLLHMRQQRLLARIGVFVGGCDLEAIAQVCATGDSHDSELVNDLAALVAQSLVQRTDKDDGTVRFTMLETIREYALEQLGRHADGEPLRQRHAAYYLALAEQAEPQLRYTDQARWHDRLEQEHPNIRAAITWSLTLAGDPSVGVRFAFALRRFWMVRGHMTEGRQQLAPLLAQPNLSPGVRADALCVAAYLAVWQGDYRVAEPLWEESLALHRTVDDMRGIAESLCGLGYVAIDQRNVVNARACFEASQALFLKLGKLSRVAWTFFGLGQAAELRGEPTTAFTQYDQALALFEQVGDIHGVGWMLIYQGSLSMRQGDHSHAQTYLTQALFEAQAVDDKSSIATALDCLSILARLTGDFERAATLAAQSIARFRQVGDQVRCAAVLHNSGDLARVQQDDARALRCYTESLALFQALGHAEGTAMVSYKLTCLVRGQGLVGYYEVEDTEGIASYLEAWRVRA